MTSLTKEDIRSALGDFCLTRRSGPKYDAELSYEIGRAVDIAVCCLTLVERRGTLDAGKARDARRALYKACTVVDTVLCPEEHDD